MNCPTQGYTFLFLRFSTFKMPLAPPTSRLRASLLELRFPGSLYLFYDIYHRRRVQAFRTSICSPLLVMLETLAHLHGSLEHTPENGGRSSVRCNAGGV